MNKPILLSLGLLFVLAISLQMASADLGSYPINKCVDLKTISNSSAVTLSSLSYPNSTTILTNKAMTKIADTFNYTYCNNSVLGVYNYDYFDAEGNTFVNSYTVTSDGNPVPTTSQVITYFIGILIIITISGFFLILGFRFRGVLSLIFIALCSIFILALLLYGLVGVNTFIGNYLGVVNGLSTFAFVIELLVGISILVLCLAALWFTWQMWRIKTGRK